MTVENLCVCSRSPRTLQEELSGLRLFTVRTSHQESDQWQKRLHHWQLRCTLERLYQAELRHQMLHPEARARRKELAPRNSASVRECQERSKHEDHVTFLCALQGK
ncbi:uncharacterized protein LOC119162974 isoform X2 [Rhipicephalus microplus]|uniref:uncharacterized protein LOC119162974 isoform X2 n=1 Tax=Rhipicephalus microplus TaxID=6941 RepID=UPI003F6C5C45